MADDERRRYQSKRITGSPKPRPAEHLRAGPRRDKKKDEVRIPTSRAATPRVLREFHSRRPMVLDEPLSNRENPVYRYVSGFFHLRRRWPLWAGLYLLLASLIPLLALALRPFSQLNAPEALAVAVAFLHLALWLCYNLYAIAVSGIVLEGIPRYFLIDAYLTLLRPGEICKGLHQARLHRFGLLVLALIPFELMTLLYCYSLNPTATRSLFLPIFLLLFLLDLYGSMAMNLANGYRAMVELESPAAARVRAQFWTFIFYPALFAAWLFFIYKAIWPLCYYYFDYELHLVQLVKDKDMLWPSVSFITLMVLFRLIYVFLFRFGYARRSFWIYRDNFERWMRHTVAEEVD